MAKDLITFKNIHDILFSEKKQTLKEYAHYDPIIGFLNCMYMCREMK